jgi:hypothetical protein
MNALSTVLSNKDPDADTVSIAQQAGIFTGWSGTTRPTLQTDGNFTAVTGETYRMGDLFKGSAPAGQTVAGYRVALGAGGGQLWLNGNDVTGQTTPFTANDFRQLTYVAGTDGSSQNLTVVAQTGTLQSNGTLTQEIDSPAVQITANVTGSRSINAMNALSTQLSEIDPDASTVSIAQQAGILTGWSGATRPTLQTALNPDPPLPISDLQNTDGAYRSAGVDPASSDTTDLSAFYAASIGNEVSPGLFTSPGGTLETALLLLDGEATGAFQTAGDLTLSEQAIKAYNATASL